MGSISPSVQDGAIHVKKTVLRRACPRWAASFRAAGLTQGREDSWDCKMWARGSLTEQSLRNMQNRQQQPGCTEGRRNHFRNLTEKQWCVATWKMTGESKPARIPHKATCILRRFIWKSLKSFYPLFHSSIIKGNYYRLYSKEKLAWKAYWTSLPISL